jgi:hypothetical protein
MVLGLILASAGCAPNRVMMNQRFMMSQAARNAPVGQDFSTAAMDGFVLNETTMEQAEAALGMPAKQAAFQGIASPAAKDVPPGTAYSMKLVTYEFFPYGTGYPAKMHPFKQASLIFSNGMLIADAVNATIPGQSNLPVDEGKLASLRQCRTTPQEAIALLGTPNAFSVYVQARRPGPKYIEYLWSGDTSGEVEQRDLRIYFDKSGVMTSYAFLKNAQPSGLPGATPLLKQAASDDSKAPVCPGPGRS